MLLGALGVGTLLAGASVRLASPSLLAQTEDEIRYFRIGTGATSGSYFAIGGVIANVISNPPGSRPCDRGGNCGVPGLIAVAQTTQGSVDNIDGLAKHTLESGLSQSDIAYWAYSGTGNYAGEKPHDTLSAIANLYQESLHIFVRSNSDIASIADLKGKRVSYGERGSGTRATARAVLEAYGLGAKQVKGAELAIGPATERLRDGTLDAVIFVGGAPVPALVELARSTPLRLLPVDGDKAETLRRSHPFLTVDLIPASSYGDNPNVITVGVGTYWLVSAELDEQFVHDITQALWHPSNRK
ncbi:MAG: TAXI family TRAP transporter solute-binding subunit, partial [Dongiaceae bacterium]